MKVRIAAVVAVSLMLGLIGAIADSKSKAAAPILIAHIRATAPDSSVGCDFTAYDPGTSTPPRTFSWTSGTFGTLKTWINLRNTGTAAPYESTPGIGITYDGPVFAQRDPTGKVLPPGFAHLHFFTDGQLHKCDYRIESSSHVTIDEGVGVTLGPPATGTPSWVL